MNPPAIGKHNSTTIGCSIKRKAKLFLSFSEFSIRVISSLPKPFFWYSGNTSNSRIYAEITPSDIAVINPTTFFASASTANQTQKLPHLYGIVAKTLGVSISGFLSK